MSSAAGLVTGSPLQVALQMPPDAAAPLAQGGTFTAAMAAACVDEPEAGMPDGMQSVAALAWIAGLMGAAAPLSSQTGLPADAGPPADATDTPVSDLTGTSDEIPAAALGFLQGMLQPGANHGMQETIVPGDSTVDSDLPISLPAVAERAVAIRAQPAANVIALSTPPGLQVDDPASSHGLPVTGMPAADASPVTASHATPLAAPLAALRAMIVSRHPDEAADPQSGHGVSPATDADNPVTSNVQVESRTAERLIGALAERVSMRAESASVPADFDRTAIGSSNPHLYASARETVATTAGHVSSRPEVVHATVGSPRWANELGSRLAMMSVRGQNEGSLSLTPEHLGPLEVRISMTQDTTNVWFGAQNADARAALAEAIPRLREMFAAQGLALGHAGVSHEMPGQTARQGEASALRSESMSETPETPPVKAVRVRAGLLDAWA